jgi:hypothetical protein
MNWLIHGGGASWLRIKTLSRLAATVSNCLRPRQVDRNLKRYYSFFLFANK